MNRLTMDDVVNHIVDCSQCKHLVDQVGNFSQELLEKAVIVAHNKKKVRA